MVQDFFHQEYHTYNLGVVLPIVIDEQMSCSGMAMFSTKRQGHEEVWAMATFQKKQLFAMHVMIWNQHDKLGDTYIKQKALH